MALIEEKNKTEIVGEKLAEVDSHGNVLLPNLSKADGGVNNAVKFLRKDASVNYNNEYCNINEAREIGQETGFDLINNNSRVNDSARLFTNPFAEMDMELDTGVPMYKTLLGRTEINLVARGVVAALAFTAGSYMLKEWQMGGEQKWFTKPLEWTANSIDAVISNPVTKAIGAIIGDEEKAKHIMTFNKYVAKSHIAEKALVDSTVKISDVMGMSLGQAAVHVSGPFVAGSIGAAIGRNMMLLLDPNYKTSWWHNGQIDFGDMVKSTAQEAFRIVTYNAGEDLIVTIPYLISRRFANGVLASTDIGNIWELQNGSGNTHLVDENGDLGKSYELTGLIRTQYDFPIYNFGTLMFRDAYNHVGHSFSEWKKNDFAIDLKMPENPVADAVHSVCESLKYVAKSFIKSQIYMQPSMLFFSGANVAIGKNDAALMSDVTNEFITTQKTYSLNVEDMNQWNAPFKREDGTVPAYNQIAVQLKNVQEGGTYYARDKQVNLDKLVSKDIFEHHSSPISGVMNPLGKALNCYTNVLHENVAAPMFNAMGLDGHSNDAKFATKTFARAQAAYFPYMMAKYEFAQKWDTPDMDAAIYRALDGITSVNGVELWAGIKDIGNLIAMQAPSPETHAKSFEHRGLINSTCEAKIKTATSQENIKRRDAEERHVNDVPEIVRPLNHIASDIIMGKAKEVELHANNNLVELINAGNNIISFDSEHKGKIGAEQEKELALLK
jgi:hypothetical protein